MGRGSIKRTFKSNFEWHVTIVGSRDAVLDWRGEV